MRKLYRLFFCLSLSPALGQTSLEQDALALDLALQKTKSFKQQIKGKDKKEYYNRLQAVKSSSSLNDLDYLEKLSSLVLSVEDHHMSLYQLKSTPPFYEGEINVTPSDSLEGEYEYGNWYKVKVFKKDDSYIGIIHSSDVPHWKAGEIVFTLHRKPNGSLWAIYAHPYTKNYVLCTQERYQQGSLLHSEYILNGQRMWYQKPGSINRYPIKLHAKSPKFQHQILSDKVQYTLIRSFQRNPITTSSSDSLIAELDAAKPLPYWIIDLRENEGGSRFAMRKYLKRIKQYKGGIFVLMNHGTLSQAELLILKIRKMNNVTLSGETTRGMLTYGSNYGRRLKLDDGNLIYYPTDMPGRRKILKWEGKGIPPDLPLKTDQDPIEQILKILESN
ncbi:S41 family peptidase [Leadbetterella byssophila]|uniref:S41 family peptidase n=1 Tax=Leadbetterella byssophila TaxID=316068 RepID=UPI0039A12C11